MSESWSIPSRKAEKQSDHAMGCYYLGLIRLSDGLMHRWMVVKGCMERHEGSPRS